MQTNSNSNIADPQNKVQTKQAVSGTNVIGHKAIIKASAESILAEIEEDLFTTSLSSGKLLEAKELKKHLSFRALMEADGHKLQTSGAQVKCCCPFHPDRTPSFVIFDTDDYAKCFGCGWYGDIYKYEQEFHQVDFKNAWFNLNDFLRQCPRTGRKAKVASKTVKIENPEFTPRQLKERKNYADRLANEAWLAEKVCILRLERTGETWDPGIIQALGKEGSLGWADCLAFIYPRGTKYRRWPGKEFIWDCDGSSLWRGELLAGATHVYLTESETDAIALLHTGIEQDEEGSAIVAVSGAGNFQSEWAQRFKNKVVTLCFDSDEAGKDGANKTGLFLKPFVSELFIYELGGAI